jgi:sodium/potassium-transporting ATPase subunit beta
MEYTVKDKARLEEVDTRSLSSDGQQDGFLWRQGEFLGRSALSWVKLVLFYVLFCGILALLWGLCIGLMFQTVDFYIPKYIQKQGLVGANPGLGFRPLGGLGLKQKNGTGQWSPPSVYSSLIWFRHGAGGNWGDMKASMDLFLRQYEPGYFPNQGASLTKCDFENTPLTPNSNNALLNLQGKDKSCEFNKEWLSDQGSDYKCITQEDYGYRFGKPCILVKLNRIYDWRPDPFTIGEIRNHTSMPRRLKADIQKIYDDKCDGRFEEPCPFMNMVWLHCDGETDSDIEYIGPITYTPFRGFPGYFYPYRNQRGYLSPIVMVQLKNPEPGVSGALLHCTALHCTIVTVASLSDINSFVTAGPDEYRMHGLGSQPQAKQAEAAGTRALRDDHGLRAGGP